MWPFFFIFLLCIAGFGQKSSKPKLSYKLLSVRVKGATHLKDEQVIAASGLKLGQLAAESDFQRAMQALGDSGLQIQARAAHFESVGQILLGVPPEAFL